MEKIVVDMSYRCKCLIIGLVVALGISVGILVAYISMSLSDRPAIHISQSNINFGALAAGTKVEKKIVVSNIGQRDLIIHNVKSGCGCLQVRLSQNVIAPNESTQLYLIMNATEYGQRTDVLIFSNAGIAMLSVSAEVAMQAMVAPAIIDFGQVADLEGLPVSREVSILLNDDLLYSSEHDDLVFLTDHAYLKIDCSKPVVGRSKPIVLTLPSDTPIGDIFTELQLQTDSQMVSIRVIGTIRGQFFSLPPMLLFHQVSQNDNTISKTVEIRSRYQNGIGDVPTIDSFELCCFLKPILIATRSDTNRVILTLSPSNPSIFWAPSTINGTLSLKCSSDRFDAKIVSVPIQITLRMPRVVEK